MRFLIFHRQIYNNFIKRENIVALKCYFTQCGQDKFRNRFDFL